MSHKSWDRCGRCWLWVVSQDFWDTFYFKSPFKQSFLSAKGCKTVSLLNLVALHPIFIVWLWVNGRLSAAWGKATFLALIKSLFDRDRIKSFWQWQNPLNWGEFISKLRCIFGVKNSPSMQYLRVVRVCCILDVFLPYKNKVNWNWTNEFNHQKLHQKCSKNALHLTNELASEVLSWGTIDHCCARASGGG